MRTLARVSFSSLLVILTLSRVTAVQADAPATQKGTGAVTGRVVDSDGKPVAGAHVRAFDAEAISKARQKNRDNPAGAKESRPDPVAKTETGADGTFKLENVPAGRIRVIAGLQGSGVGMVRGLVIVKSDETEKVGDISLSKPLASKPGQNGRNKPGDDAPQK